MFHSSTSTITDSPLAIESRRRFLAGFKDNRQYAWLLACIVVLGFAIRLAGVSTHSFWYDEAVTAEIAGADYAEILSGEAADLGNPPLYWIVAKVTACDLYGDFSPEGLRWFSIVCGVMTIIILADIARLIATRWAAVLCGSFWAISPLSVELSTSARAYALLHMLTAANTLIFIHWLQAVSSSDALRTKRLWLIRAGYIVTMSMMCLTHYFAVLVVFSHAATLFVLRARWKKIGDWLLQAVIAGGLSIFWLPVFLQQLESKGNVSRFMESWATQFFATPLVFSLGRTLVWRDDPALVLASVSAVALALFWVPALLGIRYTLFRSAQPKNCRFSGKPGVVIPIWIGITLAAPIGFSFVLGAPIYHLRAASVALPAFVLLVGIGLSTIPIRAALPVVATCSILTVLSLLNFYSEPLKDDWRSATPEIVENVKSGDLLVFDTEIEVVPFLYYARRADTNIPANMIGLTEGLLIASSKDDVDGSHAMIKLPGVSWRDGQQMDKEGVDCSEKILSRNSFWIVACKPYTTPDDYIDYFRQHGFEPAQQLNHHRIDVLKFVRPEYATKSTRDNSGANFDDTSA